ncbi:MAG TPA: hypothetical protein VFT22_21230 [Kofleriaceae bacterium]|nr:hypothetical protein [Kofleriaceae bacterium]
MREAARALDDVSDHLGEVVRRADELLAEWGRFGAQVRAQVDHEVAAIGEVVDGAVARAAGAGLDRAIAERLRALTTEIERLEQRTRAASRAVVEHRDADRRLLWIVIAGIAVANALLVALLLRRPAPEPVAEPVRIESAAPSPVNEAAPVGSPASGPEPMASGGAGAAAGAPGSGAAGPTASAAGSPGSGAPPAATTAAPGMTPAPASASPPGGKPGSAVPGGPAAPSAGSTASAPGARPPADAGAPARPTASPIALPPRGGARPHKKSP